MGRHKKVEEITPEKGQKIGDYLSTTLENLERANSAIYSRLEEFAERLRKLETPIKVETPDIASQTKEEQKLVPENQSSFPVPSDYLELVNTLLNSKFGVKVEGLTDRPQFAFTIVVPKEYSSLPPVEWQTAKGDFRTKILNYADGINGVREWVIKVYDSFNPETKAKIKSEI